MKLGFVSAILPELSLEELLAFARLERLACIEAMCWPVGKAERRFAGVTHIDVTRFTQNQADKINEQCDRHGVSLSGLGYYPNPLDPDAHAAKHCVEHLKKVIIAAEKLGLKNVNTFAGRDWSKSVDENWPRFLKTWRPLTVFAEDHDIKIGLENCPMLFTRNEWPGGKNLATTPSIWRRMFHDIPSPNFGLNFDPSHLIWQHVDYIAPLAEFKDRIFHVHAKDARIDQAALDQHGVLSYPNLWHTPKIPGLGDIRWGAFFGALSDTGYKGHVAIEVEDRAFEGSVESRLDSLVISRRYLLQYIKG